LISKITKQDLIGLTIKSWYANSVVDKFRGDYLALQNAIGEANKSATKMSELDAKV